MTDFRSSQRPAGASMPCGATVADIASRRCAEDMIATITLVFGGVNYGTIPVAAPYAKGKPIVLYLVPAANGAVASDADLRGRLDCLITDDPALAFEQQAAR